MSRRLKIIGLFCRISSLLQGSFAKETCTFKAPTNRSHPIQIYNKRPPNKEWQHSGRISHTQIYTTTLPHTSTITHTHIPAYTYYTYTREHAHAHTHTHTHTHTNLSTHTHTHTQPHSHISPQSHRLAHTYTHTHEHAHAQILCDMIQSLQ